MRYKQTFENFVLSAANEIPVIVVKSILTKDGPNQIILYGPSGSGKTHGRGTQENRTQEFSDQLHSLDLLLIDDVSLLAYKNETTKFFVSLATDIDGPRIVTTSSINLDSAPGFSTKCTYEISQGVTVQLVEPDGEIARGIVLDRATRFGMNGHTLIGAVETLRAYTVAQEIEIKPELVKRVLTVSI